MKTRIALCVVASLLLVHWMDSRDAKKSYEVTSRAGIIDVFATAIETYRRDAFVRDAYAENAGIPQ